MCSDENASSQENGQWNRVPFDILCNVFAYLTPRQRYRASCVCWLWYEAFFVQSSWDVFVFKDYVFTRRKYLQIGPQYVPDYYRLRFLINRVASLWRVLIIHPVTLFFNMYEFLRALTNYCEYYDRSFLGDSPLKCLRNVEFSWYCKFHTISDQGSTPATEVYGTGGQLLKGLTNFLANLVSLQSLTLRHLLLDFSEAEVFLSDLLAFFGDRLTVLSLRNLTKVPGPISQVAFFLRLKKLVLSPSNLSDDLLELLADHRCLKSLVLVQDDNTPDCEPLAAKEWARLKDRNPFIRVFLHVTGRCESRVIWQPYAPVVSIIFEHPGGALSGEDTDVIVDYYRESLRSLIQKGRQRRYRSKSYGDRIDPLLLRIVEECRYLEVLAVRERLSSSTALYLAHLIARRSSIDKSISVDVDRQLIDKSMSVDVGSLMAPCFDPTVDSSNLFGNNCRFLCRRKAVLKRTDFVYSCMGWSQEFYRDFAANSQDYDVVQVEIGRLLGVKGYKFLSDNDYRFAFADRGNYFL